MPWFLIVGLIALPINVALLVFDDGEVNRPLTWVGVGGAMVAIVCGSVVWLS
jgi:hypothetical protein